jgi:hypothetical protein
MPRIAGFGLLVAIAVGVAPLAIAASGDDELDRLRGTPPSPDTSYRGMHSDFYDQPIGRFMDLLAAGAITEAKALRPRVCAAWAADRGRSALTGNFSVGEVSLSLDRLCGLAPLPARR